MRIITCILLCAFVLLGCGDDVSDRLDQSVKAMIAVELHGQFRPDEVNVVDTQERIRAVVDLAKTRVSTSRKRRQFGSDGRRLSQYPNSLQLHYIGTDTARAHAWHQKIKNVQEANEFELLDTNFLVQTHDPGSDGKEYMLLVLIINNEGAVDPALIKNYVASAQRKFSTAEDPHPIDLKQKYLLPTPFLVIQQASGKTKIEKNYGEIYAIMKAKLKEIKGTNTELYMTVTADDSPVSEGSHRSNSDYFQLRQREGQALVKRIGDEIGFQPPVNIVPPAAAPKDAVIVFWAVNADMRGRYDFRQSQIQQSIAAAKNTFVGATAQN